jgi:hypothetical protein
MLPMWVLVYPQGFTGKKKKKKPERQLKTEAVEERKQMKLFF